MAAKRRNDGDACKRAAVRLVTAQGYGVAATARHLGINTHRLGRWKRELAAKQHAAFPGHGPGSPETEAVQR